MTSSSGRTRIVGILNVTPDSFSDGNASFRPNDAIAAIAAMIDAGADVIDIGAESTRPGAVPIDAAAEQERLTPMLGEAIALCHERGCETSLDTRHASTAGWALGLGIDWINDVSGLKDPMLSVVADHRCRLILMHSLVVPPRADIHLDETIDSVEQLLRFIDAETARLERAGIDRHRLVFDPGLGFGKTAAQNWQLLTRVPELRAGGLPLLIGHSRKSFLRRGFGQDVPASDDRATLTASAFLMQQGVSYLRVHSVGNHATLRGMLAA